MENIAAPSVSAVDPRTTQQAIEIRIARKTFFRILLAGAGVLAPFDRAAQAQSRHPDIPVAPPPSANETYNATRVMIVRHAEKPVEQINGIDEFGNTDSTSLIPQGWQRAGALVPLFSSSF
jgi:hypothetical protein